MTKALEQAIIGYWGERCADFDAGCPCCKAWAELDALEGGVTVKPLEWVDTISFAKRKLIAFDVFGNEFARLDYDPDEDNMARIREFKVRSQADYERRILSAPAQRVEEGEPVSLAECPIGLFMAGDELCLKTEYGNNEGRIDAYIVSSGEFFWGSQPQTIANQRKQCVRPVTFAASPAPAPHAGVDDCDHAWTDTSADGTPDWRCVKCGKDRTWAE